MALWSLWCCVALFGGRSAGEVFTVNQDGGTGKNGVDSEAPGQRGKFAPTWDSLDARPLPAWYDEAKFGIRIHWGVFSIPSFGSEQFWRSWQTESGPSLKYRDFMKQRYRPSFTYQDFAKEFTAEFFNATEWSKLFEAAGAKYVVLTSKHHEGYTLWPSKRSFSWNSMDVGPKRDLVAIRENTKMRFGLYYSLFEWYNPLWLADQSNNFTSDDFVTSKTLPELRELVELYKPEVIWSDGGRDAPDTYWKSKEFLAWLYNESPVRKSVVVNDRWGHGTAFRHGDFYTSGVRFYPDELVIHKWENAKKIDVKSWGYRRNARLADYLTIAELIRELVATVSWGGNLLLNVGPTKDGVIDPAVEERLRQMGDWLSANGEAIYGSEPWELQNDKVNENVWWTANRPARRIYGSILRWPEDNLLRVTPIKLSDDYRVCLLGPDCKYELPWKNTREALEITLPIEARGAQPAWVFRIELLRTHPITSEMKYT